MENLWNLGSRINYFGPNALLTLY